MSGVINKTAMLDSKFPDAIELDLTAEQKKFLEAIIEISGQNVNKCFQCKKCTAGCPVANIGAMDITPTQVIHAVRLGQVDMVLNSHTIWVCASCETCTSRCPQGVDIAKVMDAARIYAKRIGRADAEKDIDIFFTEFMKNVDNYGMLYELGLALGIKFKTKEFFKDANLGRAMFFKGKLNILPHKSGNAKEVRDMLKNIKELESK